MSNRWWRTLVALAGAGAILVALAWLDTVMMVGIQQRQSRSFDINELAWTMPFAYLAVAGGVLVVGLLGRWAGSLVGVPFVVVGAFFAFLVPLNWLFAVGLNNTPPVLPEPLASFIQQVYIHAGTGPLGAVSIVGAGMLLVGLGTIGLTLRNRVSTAPRAADVALAAQPSPR
jgi:hypothetical protein